MYTEEYDKRGFPIRDFIMKLILIIIFVLLLCWLLPKFLAPAISKSLSNNNGNSCSVSETCEKGINALTSQIFLDNIERMKNAAISYYTEERLPKEVEQSSTMTLSDMIGKKLIVPLIDKNNKAVDVEKSYVKITKMSDEYLLKVNLKDSEKEDYILVHLGCYNYCESYICQKQGTETKGSSNGNVVPIKAAYDSGIYYIPDNPQPVVDRHYCVYYNGKYYDKNGNVVSKDGYLKSCTTQPEVKHYCVIYNGKYYDKNGNVVSEAEYKKSCGIPEEKHYCEYYNGNYYDKSGRIVDVDSFIASCFEEEKHYCVYYNGKYYDKNGNVVSKSEYEKSCGITPPEEKHYCVYYNGKYYDKNGNVVSEAEYKKSCGIPEDKHYCVYYNEKYYDKYGNVVSKEEYEKSCGVEYLYEYKKTTNAKLSEWTKWTDWSKTNCSTAEINCSDNDISCIKKLQILKRKEEIGTYDKTYARERPMNVQTGSYTQKACSKYNYVIINSTIYATTTTTTYTQVNTITTTTRTTTGGWVYNGRASYSNPPSDRAGTHYIFAGADYSYCGNTCTTLPNYYYDSYTYSGGMTTVSSTTTPGDITSSTSSQTTSTTTTTTQASCGEIVTKTVPIYKTITVTEKATRKEKLYGDVCYQSTKTRSVLDPGKTTYKWSVYNDTSLLNDGWVYTGNYKQK